MFPLNSSQRAAFAGLRREFEKAVGVPAELPRSVAVFDTDTALIIEIDVPGIDRADIELTLEKDVLFIRGERNAPELEFNAARDNRPVGKIEHVFHLGFPVNPEGLDALCENGVLRVILPKTPTAQPKRIEIRDRKDSMN